jgi:hypothetical protein
MNTAAIVTVKLLGGLGLRIIVFATNEVKSLWEVAVSERIAKHHVPLPRPVMDLVVAGYGTITVTGAGVVRSPFWAALHKP